LIFQVKIKFTALLDSVQNVYQVASKQVIL